MTAPLSMDMRRRIIETLKEGYSGVETAERLKVSTATVSNIKRLFETQGTVEPKPMGGARRPKAIQKEGKEFLEEEIKKKPDIFYHELAELYNEKYGTTLTRETIRRTLLNMGYVKKNRSFVIPKQTPKK